MMESEPYYVLHFLKEGSKKVAVAALPSLPNSLYKIKKSLIVLFFGFKERVCSI